MRVLALAVAAALAIVPAGADAKRPRKRARFHPGKAVAAVGWAGPVFTLAPVAPAATPAPAPNDPAPTPTPAPTPPPSTVPAANPHSVSVRSTEFRFSLSQPSVEAGSVKVQFDNSAAEDPHALAYRGPSEGAFDPVDPGSVVPYTVTLTAGTYTLFCPLPQHEGLGMKATLTVR